MVCVFYPSCYFPNIDKKHFFKLLGSLNSIFTVSVHCFIFAILEIVLILYTFVIIHVIFFAALALSASCANFVPLITFEVCWLFHLFYSTFYIKLLYLGHPEFFEISHFMFLSFPFFFSLLRLKKTQALSNTLLVCICITWWYYFFTHVDIHIIW